MNELKKARILRSMTLDDASKVLGVSTQTYSRWEADPTLIRVHHMHQLLEFFDITYEALYNINKEEE